MTTRKKTETTNASSKESMSNDLGLTHTPLIFISHDTRDAELAEEFSKLLKSASSGALKSFRSSDKKGTTGIPYGEEWYPAIMDKIDEASDVVCLLTRHSVDRPWILYEAGVAKGKLDKKVIGIALGIPFKEAVSGPFAQFQNNDGDVESITSLVLLLVKKIGLDPDQELVKMLVEKFTKRVDEITANVERQNSDSDTAEANSVTKLFEEVKIMFDALPARIESRVDPSLKKRRRKHLPMMLEELFHVVKQPDESFISFLIMISWFREDYPWLYEVGLDTYQSLKSLKSHNQRRRVIKTFEDALEITSHPLIREFYEKSEDNYMLLKETRRMTRLYLDRFIGEPMPGKEDESIGYPEAN